MKKFTLLCAGVSLLASVSANGTAPAYQWNYLMDTPNAQDAPREIVISSDGKAISLSHFSSNTATTAFNYDGELIGNGPAVSSENRTPVIIKHNADGKKVWAVYASSGYGDTSDASIIPTSDGGVVAQFKVRSSQDGTTWYAPEFVDASGARNTLPEWNLSCWIYQQLLVKINGEGNIEWMRTFDMDQTPVNNKVMTDGVNPSGVCVDESGNIYVGGYIRMPMIAEGVSASHYVALPRNMAGWSGDTQGDAPSSIYIMKLDKDGNYLGRTEMTSENIIYERLKGLTYADGQLYFAAIVKPKAGEEGTLASGTSTATLAANSVAWDNLVAGAVNTSTMECSWLTALKSYGNTAGKVVLGVSGVDVADGALYVYGAVNGGLGAAGSSVAAVKSSAAQLQAMAVKFSTADGAFDGGVWSEVASIGAYTALVKYDGKTGFYGHVMMDAKKDGEVYQKAGTYLDYVDENTWTVSEHNSLINAALCALSAAAVNPVDGMLYCFARSNAAFSFAGTDVTSDKPTQYGSVFACFSLGSTSGVESVAVQNGLRVRGEAGEIVIEAAEPTEVTVTNVAGMNVYNATVDAGETRVALSAGVYMVADAKILVK